MHHRTLDELVEMTAAAVHLFRELRTRMLLSRLGPGAEPGGQACRKAAAAAPFLVQMWLEGCWTGGQVLALAEKM